MKQTSTRDVVTLEELGAKVVTVLKTLDQDAKFKWTAFNPSVVKVDKKIYISIRSSNYLIMPDGQYVLYDYGDVLNRLWIGEIDGNLQIENLHRVEQTEKQMRRGMEDARLFRRNGEMQLCAVGLENWIPTAKVIECSLDDKLENITGLMVLQGPEKKRVEKNWMPVHDVDTDFDYLYSPVMKYKVNRGLTEIQPSVEIPKSLRGGSQLIEHDGGLLGVMHQTLIFSEMQKFSSATFSMENVQRRKYVHYLVKFDRYGSITAVSKPFYFTRPGVEFCAGIARVDDGFILSYGHEDRESRITHVTHEIVENLFQA